MDVYLISIGTKAARGQTPLPYAEENAASMAALFTSGRSFVAPQHVKLLLGPQANAAALDRAIRAVPAGSFLILYAMLHGGSGGLALADGTLYPHAQLRKNLAATRARGVLLLLDSCHAGVIVGGLGAPPDDGDWLELMLRAVPGFRYILASSASDVTTWSPEYRGGLYTWALRQAAMMVAPGDLGRSTQYVSAALVFDRICAIAPPGLAPVADGPLEDVPLFRANDRVLGAANVIGLIGGHDFGATANILISGRRGIPLTVVATAFDELGVQIASTAWEVRPTTALDATSLTCRLDLPTVLRSPIASQQLAYGMPILIAWQVSITDGLGRSLGVWTLEFVYEPTPHRLRAASRSRVR